MEDKKQFSVILVEDEFLSRKLLINYIETRPELKLAKIAKNGEEALKSLLEEKYDLLLLDIHLPDISGIEVLERINNFPYVIFTTAFDQYAVKAFDLGALDYLLKPIHIDRFNQAIDRFITANKKNNLNIDFFQELAFSFREDRNQYIVAYQDIIYFSSYGKHTVIHTTDRDFETSCLLKDIEEKLPQKIFIRIHKQYMVNKQYISHLKNNEGGQYYLFLKDDDESSLPVGRSFVPLLKDNDTIVQMP